MRRSSAAMFCSSLKAGTRTLAARSVVRVRRRFPFDVGNAIGIDGNARVVARAMFALSQDGKTLASWGFESSIQLWDLARGKHRNSFPGHHAVVADVADEVVESTSKADTIEYLREVKPAVMEWFGRQTEETLDTMRDVAENVIPGVRS